MQKRINMFIFLALFSFHNSQAGWFTAAGAYVSVKLNGWMADRAEDRLERERQNQPEALRQQNPAPRVNRDLVRLQRETMARTAAIAFLFTPTP